MLAALSCGGHDALPSDGEEVTMTDKREPPLQEPPPPDMPRPDDPPLFVDRPERDPYRGHLFFVAIALLIMLVAWWGY